jgi:hypothetical protein
MLREGRQSDLEVNFQACRDTGTEVIVLSAEDLSILKESELAVLRSLVGAEVEIVFYLRRWCELLPSNAQEDVRQGGTRILPEFCVDHLAAPFTSDVVNLGLKIDRLARAFGTDRIRLVSFNNVLDEKMDIFVHFVTELLRLDATGLTLPTQKHESVAIHHIELLRALNVIRKTRGDERKVRIGDLQKHDLSKLVGAMRMHEATMGLDEFARPFSTLYEELTGRYANLLVPPSPGGRLFQRQKKRLPFISPDYLMSPGIVEELGRLYRMVTTGQAA